MKLESKGAYDSLHISHLIFTHYSCCVCVHVTHFTVYRYYPVCDIDLIDFYNFKDPILWTYLSNFNETYIIEGVV